MGFSDFSWFSELSTNVMGAGSAFIDAIDEVFGEGVGMGAISGAFIGGVTATLTGEDIIDGALLGGGIGGVVGGLGTAYSGISKPGTEAGILSEEVVETPEAPAVEETPQFEDLGLKGSYGLSNFEVPGAGEDGSISTGNFVQTEDNLSASLALVGFNENTAFNAGLKLSEDLELDPNEFYGVKNNPEPKSAISSFWEGMGKDAKKTLMGEALKGAASMYVNNKNNRAADKRAKEAYEREKLKLGNVRVNLPKYSIDKPAYQKSKSRGYSSGLLSN